ncbi:hypothetical protein JHK87_039985 [Glycine soja]|nr:hypothetical protein JHK87_039985 [Glycine soja]
MAATRPRKGDAHDPAQRTTDNLVWRWILHENRLDEVTLVSDMPRDIIFQERHLIHTLVSVSPENLVTATIWTFLLKKLSFFSSSFSDIPSRLLYMMLIADQIIGIHNKFQKLEEVCPAMEKQITK